MVNNLHFILMESHTCPAVYPRRMSRGVYSNRRWTTFLVSHCIVDRTSHVFLVPAEPGAPKESP